MTTEPELSVSFYKSIGGAVREIVQGIVLVGFSFFLFWTNSGHSVWVVVVWTAIALGILLAGLWKWYVAYLTLKPGGRLAMRISDHGLTFWHGDYCSWSEIECLVVYSGTRGASVNRQVNSSFSRAGDLRIVVYPRNKEGQDLPRSERGFPVAFERDLVGRTDAFNELVSVLYPHAQRHGVPMTVEALHRPWIAEQLGIPRQEGSVW